MDKIVLFDTAEASDNLGDQIIMDYCEKQLEKILPDNSSFIYKIPTHIEVGRSARNLNRKSKISFVCGTNILKTSILIHKLWKISLLDVLLYKNICLMGVGWGNYNKFNSDPYTKWVYRKLLINNMLHSVRDEYTKQKLESLRINNVIYTACPTMWELSPEHCKSIPKQKANSVMTTLTAYKADVENDTLLLTILTTLYDQVFFWSQQIEDLDYLMTLNFDKSKLIVVPSTLKAYDDILRNKDVDFVGTRLHAGIRALNHKRRTIIISIDNRAKEIHRTTNLPICDRYNISKLNDMLITPFATILDLPFDNIRKWKQQFRMNDGKFVTV